jgi:hypothetical protein
MSASNDGNDPKGKSAETAINIAPPRVLLVDDSPSDCVTTSINLGRHDVLGMHDCYYEFLCILTCKIIFKCILVYKICFGSETT